MKSVDANFGEKVWKDFSLNLAQKLSIYYQLISRIENIYRTIIYPIELVCKSEFSFVKKRDGPGP